MLLALYGQGAAAQSETVHDDSLEGSSPQSLSTSPTPPRGDLLKLETQPAAELLVSVELTGNDPSARYEVRSTVSDSVLLICNDTCRFRIWPGRYRLITNAKNGRVRGEHPSLVEKDSVIRVKTSPPIEPILGGIVAATGVVAILWGGYRFSQSHCDETCSAATARNNRLGAAILLGGAVTVPVGMLLLANGLEPNVELVSANSSSAQNTRVYSDSKPTRYGLSWSMTF
jgi:hypothetical protein